MPLFASLANIPSRDFKNDYNLELRRSRLTDHTESSTEDAPDLIDSKHDLDE